MTIARADGLKQIDDARWLKDEYGCLNLDVQQPNGSLVRSCLSLRPTYCDRGHIQFLIEGDLGIDGADSFPRFFFSVAEADAHVRAFLKWRIWKERIHPHTLDVK